MPAHGRLKDLNWDNTKVPFLAESAHLICVLWFVSGGNQLKTTGSKMVEVKDTKMDDDLSDGS